MLFAVNGALNRHGLPSAANISFGLCNAEIGPERGNIQNHHDQREQVHPHRKTDCDMHSENAYQPAQSRLFQPDEEWVTRLDQTDRNPEDG